MDCRVCFTQEDLIIWSRAVKSDGSISIRRICRPCKRERVELDKMRKAIRAEMHGEPVRKPDITVMDLPRLSQQSIERLSRRPFYTH